MNQTTDTESAPFQPASRPSLTRRFFGGAASGLFNGALMMGLFTGVMYAFSFTPWGAAFHIGAALTTAALGITTTSLFGGVMAVKRAMEESPGSSAMRDNELGANMVMVPTVGQGMQPMLDVAEDATPTTRWADRTGRSTGNQNNIDRIIADGAMTDKSRAQALLAERATAADKAATLA